MDTVLGTEDIAANKEWKVSAFMEFKKKNTGISFCVLN